MAPDGYRVGVLGATGAVGSTMLQVLGERGFPASEVVPLASERSAGRKLAVRAAASSSAGRSSDETIQGLDLVLSSAGGEVSAEWAPKLVEAGAVVVDNTSYWRMHDDVPLVVAEVNPEALDVSPGDRRQPELLDDADGRRAGADPPRGRDRADRRLHLPAGVGDRAGGRWRSFATRRTRCSHDAEPPAAEVYPHRIAFNVLPQVETFKGGDDYTTEERKMMAETRKILGVGEEELRISATCVRVPVLYGRIRVGQRADPRAAVAGGVPGALGARAGRGRRRRARARASTRWRATPPAATRCWSAASAATPRTSAASTSGSSATTCARARRRTPSRSPSCSTSAA